MVKTYLHLALLICSLGLLIGAKPLVVNGQLSKADVQGVLEQGPQSMVASVQVEPFKENGRFLGFKLISAAANSVLARSQTIMIGDILISVNGYSLERPGQFMAAWDSIGRQSKLLIRVRRGRENIEFRWVIKP